MRAFLCFLVGLSLTLGDKLDRTYLPPPGSKLSGGSDGDLLGPLDYFRPSEGRPGSRRPEYETPISNVSTQFGQRPLDQGFEAKESYGQIPSVTNRPYQGTQQVVTEGSVAPTGSDQGRRTENEPLSRLPIPGIRANTKYPVTSSTQRVTTPKFSSTSAPSRFSTKAPFGFDPSEGVTTEGETVDQPSESSKNYPFNKKVVDINTPTTPVDNIQEEQGDDYEKLKYRPSQRVSKPGSTERYPQENYAGERDYYNQESRTTVRPSPFASKDQSYYSKSKPTVPTNFGDVTKPKSERPIQYSEEYPEQTVSGQREFNRQGYPTTARPTTFAPKEQTHYTKSKTVAPSRVVTENKSERPTQYSEEYPQQNESDEINYYRQGTPTARPTTFAPKDQTYSKQKTTPSRVVTEPNSERPTEYAEQYPQENVSDENNFYRQGTSTIRPNTFAPEEQNYYTEKASIPSQRPDISRVKSGRPTFGKPTYSTSTSRPIQPENYNYDQYSTTIPDTDAQDSNAFEDNRKTIKPFSSARPFIDEPKAAIKSQYTTASPINDVTDSDFEEDLTKANEKYGQNIPTYTDAQDLKPLVPTVPAFRNQEKPVPEYNRPERPQAEGDRNAVIINYQNEITPEGNFAYSYDTSDGIHADKSGTASDGVKAQGEFSYTGDDGKFYSIIYSADENGFQPRGDHLPTPPPIPEAILRVIEQAQRDKDAGISNDGSYDDTKYGYKKYNGAVVGQPKLFDNTQEVFVTKNRRPINKSTQGQYEPSTDKENGDDDDSKDYLDVEKAEDEAYSVGTSNQDDGDQYTSQYSTRRPINKTAKPNRRPGVPQKQIQFETNAPEGKYYTTRRPTVESGEDDEETVEGTTAIDGQEVYPNSFQKETTPTSGRSQFTYDQNRRVPSNVVKESDGFINSDDDEAERVPSVQKGIKVGPTKSAVKSNRFPEQRRHPYSTQVSEDNVDEPINETPDRFLTQKTRVQTTPTGPQRNQDRFVTQKYTPGSRDTDEVTIDSERRTPAEKMQEVYYDTNLNKQHYPTQKLNKPTNVKVDDFGREIISEVTDQDITGFGEQSNTGDFDSIKPTYEAQKKIASKNRLNQSPAVAQGSGYDYIPPKNKFIQEPSRTPNKYSTNGKKIESQNAPSDIVSVDEDDETAERPKGISEDSPYDGPVNPVTGKPRTKPTRPAAQNPIDSEYEYQKQYNKLFGQGPERTSSVTSTRKPFFAPESRVTYKPKEGTGFADDEISADDKETVGGDFIKKDDEIQERPTQPSDQRPPARTYSRPGYSQELRPKGEERDTERDYNTTDEEIQERPTQSFERPSYDRRPPSRPYNKTSRPGFNQVRTNEYKIPSTTYRPVFSVSVTENEYNRNYPTEPSKVFDGENKEITSNINLDKNTKIRPVGSTRKPVADGSRDVTETKTIGEDFSGPQRPQYYDPETGYHY